MALTRSLLKGMALTEEQVGAIIDAHSETVNGLKEQNKALSEKVDELNETVKNNGESDSEYKKKYEKEHSDFEAYKANQAKQGELNKKKIAYEELLKQVGVKDKAIEKLVKLQNLDDVKLDKDGKIENSKDLSESIKKDWGEFIITTQTKGAPNETPPANGGGTAMTKEQIMQITDREKRREAIRQNAELFTNGN